MILHQLIDYEILRVIWWLLLGVVLIGFAVTGGFDLGTGALLPFVAKTDIERRVVINSIGPVWEGNQVWLILGGGAIFAAWPPLYAVSFAPSSVFFRRAVSLRGEYSCSAGLSARRRMELRTSGWLRLMDPHSRQGPVGSGPGSVREKELQARHKSCAPRRPHMAFFRLRSGSAVPGRPLP